MPPSGDHVGFGGLAPPPVWEEADVLHAGILPFFVAELLKPTELAPHGAWGTHSGAGRPPEVIKFADAS
eukprot:14931241-Heterocapsa_arctica.AAC.1